MDQNSRATHGPRRAPVLVPSWIIKQLTRQSLPLSTVLNLNKLKDVCSQEDLAVLLQLNQDPELVMGVTHIGMGLLMYWGQYSKDALQRILEVLPLYRGKCDERLYAAGQEQRLNCRSPLNTPNQDACTAFEVRDVESGLDTASVLFVIVRPGHFGGPQSTQLQQELRREYLKQSYVTVPFDEVAKDPVFLQYLSQL